MIQMIAAEILFEMVSMFTGMEGPIFDNDEYMAFKKRGSFCQDE